jgi:rhodanese-related sulfurtransferase
MRLVLLLVLPVLALAGCGGGDDGASDAGARPTATAEHSPYAAAAAAAVRDVRAGDAALLDVRTDEEVAAGRAPAAVHLPLDRIEAGELPDVAKGRKLYVYCRTGRRAEVAVAALREAGYRDVTNIGGLSDWERAGGSTARGA